jgi:hypothetical protein
MRGNMPLAERPHRCRGHPHDRAARPVSPASDGANESKKKTSNDAADDPAHRRCATASGELISEGSANSPAARDADSRTDRALARDAIALVGGEFSELSSRQ